MKEIRYTMSQQQIIKNREILGFMFYALTNGLSDGVKPENEAFMNTLFTVLIDDCAKRRQSQQETFDRMPWLANSCGRAKHREEGAK